MTLGRTFTRRAGDILAYFDHPHASNGPTEAINGRLEHLRGSAPGLAKPHQLHHPSTPRNKRIQSPTTPPIMKSSQTTGSAPGPRPRARRSPLSPHARDLERSPHNPGTQPAGCTTQHRAPEHVGCETRSSDGSLTHRRADHTDSNDQASQSSGRVRHC